MKTTPRLIRKRFEYWESSRGAYILSQKYRDELREFIFTGKSKTMCNYATMMRQNKREMKK